MTEALTRSVISSRSTGQTHQANERNIRPRRAGINASESEIQVKRHVIEIINKVLQFTAVAGEAGELGKDQSSDVPTFQYPSYALGFGVLHDGFAA